MQVFTENVLPIFQFERTSMLATNVITIPTVEEKSLLANIGPVPDNYTKRVRRRIKLKGVQFERSAESEGTLVLPRV